MKIAFFETHDWEKRSLEKRFAGQKVFFFDRPLTAGNKSQAGDCSIISVFIDSVLDKEVLASLPKLALIAARSTGFDHIDMDFCRQKNIAVANVPVYGENTVAEHTFALLLGLSRKIYPSVQRTRRGDFSLQGLQGFDLKSKTLGIVGMGNIGQHVGRIANGFQMRVLAFDAHEDKKLAKKLQFEYVAFHELLQSSDVVTLHVPYNNHTHHLINSENIGLMKRGAYLINTARGGLIETGALVRALGTKSLAGAGLDVLEEEHFIKEEAHLLSKEFPRHGDLRIALQNHMLLDQENVIITGHNAFNSKEALERILETTIKNIQAFIKEKPVNIVS